MEDCERFYLPTMGLNSRGADPLTAFTRGADPSTAITRGDDLSTAFIRGVDPSAALNVRTDSWWAAGQGASRDRRTRRLSEKPPIQVWKTYSRFKRFNLVDLNH